MSGESTWLWVLNATPYTWSSNNTARTNMEVWKWPETITPGFMRPVLIEWSTRSPASASVDWFIDGTSYKFSILAKDSPTYHLEVVLHGFDADNIPKNVPIDLGWNKETMSWILSGWDGFFSCSPGLNFLPNAWMQLHLGILGDYSLKQICLPATHDSGMSKKSSGTPFATEGNIVTQTMSVNLQLARGCRYFDIRPVISEDTLFCGHYSNIDLPDGLPPGLPKKIPIGGNGESLSNIIDDLNAFTSSRRELIILRISHTENVQHGRDFNLPDWIRLFQELNKIHFLFPITTSSLVDLPLKSFIANSSAVLLVFDDNVNFEGFRGPGYYHESDIRYTDAPVYVEGVTSTENPVQMSRQCIEALRNARAPCLVGWCLTQGALNAVLTALDLGGKTILDLAALTKPVLYGDLWKNCSRDVYPNAINVDAFTSDITAFCIAINKFYALKQPSSGANAGGNRPFKL